MHWWEHVGTWHFVIHPFRVCCPFCVADYFYVYSYICVSECRCVLVYAQTYAHKQPKKKCPSPFLRWLPSLCGVLFKCVCVCVREREKERERVCVCFGSCTNIRTQTQKKMSNIFFVLVALAAWLAALAIGHNICICMRVFETEWERDSVCRCVLVHAQTYERKHKNILSSVGYPVCVACHVLVAMSVFVLVALSV